MKVITTKDFEDIPEGSVFMADEVDENSFYVGEWSSMNGTYRIAVPVEFCREWDEEVDDPITSHFKKNVLAERELDVAGEVPRRFLIFSIRNLRDELKSNAMRPQWAVDRNKWWLDDITAYYNRVYGELNEQELK